MEFIFLIAILCGSVYLGFSFSKYYKDKLLFYNELNYFCDILENEITFHKNTISEIIKKNLDSFKGVLKNSLVNYFIDKKPYKNISIITEKENAFIQKFFSSLGKFDSDGELANIKNYKLEVKKYIGNSEEDNKKIGSAGTKLGIIFGLLLCIVLI